MPTGSESAAGDVPPAPVIDPDDRFRVPPAADPVTEFFWSSGADGRLRFQRCTACGYFLHPPGPWCPECGSHDLAPAPVSGRGTVHSFTINHQPWDGDPTPFVVALVELDEQVGLRLTTNIVGCAPTEVFVDQRVRVVFERRAFDGRGTIYYPLFTPDRHRTATEAQRREGRASPERSDRPEIFPAAPLRAAWCRANLGGGWGS